MSVTCPYAILDSQLFAIEWQFAQIFVKVTLKQTILYYTIFLELCFCMFLCFFG